MIRRNESLNCACSNSNECPNGTEYADRINPINSRSFCQTISGSQIRSFSIEELDERINCRIEENRNKLPRKEIEKKKYIFDENTYRYRQINFLFTEERREQVAAKEGTANDWKRIKELLLMSDIIKEHELALRCKSQIKNLHYGIAWLSNPFAGRIAFDNRCLMIEYRNRAILSEYQEKRNRVGVIVVRRKDVFPVLPNPNRYPIKPPRFPIWAKK